ncbi:MAG: hypothetical protein LC723_12275 [Actinobacteria bacterium]|nr:hypothetical protein [Actinomycetota bacterium]
MAVPAPLSVVDLKVFEPDLPDDQAEAMIATVWSRAKRLAPCLKTEAPDPNPLDDEDNLELVKSALRAAILRWIETGSGGGGITSQGAGDFNQGLSAYSGGLFRPDEILDLQGMCSDYKSQKASTIETYPTGSLFTEHAAWCDINFGGTLCNCGADISENGLPLWKNRPIPEV